MDSVAQGGSPRDQSISGLAWIVLFFLQPRDYYVGTDTVSTPFNLQYIQFYVVTHPIR